MRSSQNRMSGAVVFSLIAFAALSLGAPSAVAAPQQAVLATPAGTTLCGGGASTTFTWTQGAEALEYWLDVGTVQGQGNLFAQNTGLTTARTVTVSPSTGTIFVRLWTRFSSGWLFTDYSFVAGSCATATITSPTPGTLLLGSDVTFSWTAHPNAQAYWLDVGTSQGSGNMFGRNVGLVTQQTVNIPPAVGGTVYVRLWTLVANVWRFADYIYESPAPGSVTPLAPGSVISFCNTNSTTFTWAPVAGALQYWLFVGTTPGNNDVFDQSTALATSSTVSNIPAVDTLFVTLWTRSSAGWSSTDYTIPVTFCGSMLRPVDGTTLPGPIVNFFWSSAVGAQAYWLDVGTIYGQGNIFAGRVGLETQQEVAGIPTNGAPIYVRLWTLFGSNWRFVDHTYTASGSLTKATLASPAGGSTLPGPSVLLRWNGGAGATEYWLDVGTSQGQGNLFARNVGLATSQVVSGLPTNGGPLFIRLWTKLNGGWQNNDYAVTAASTNTTATLATPTPGSVLSGNGVTFTWNAGSNAAAYWLDVGNSVGGDNFFGQGVGLATSAFVGGLPTDGSTTYVRLWTQSSSSTWSSIDYTFVAGSPTSKAVLTSPTANVMLSGASVTFSWNAGSGATAYWLDVGSAAGVGNYFGANVGLATSRTVTGLPTNGSPVFVRLWTNINGTWDFNDYSFTALH